MPHELRLKLDILFSASTLFVIGLLAVQITSIMASLLLWPSLFVALILLILGLSVLLICGLIGQEGVAIARELVGLVVVVAH